VSDSPKNLYKKLLGRKGELLAQGFLKKKGYKILQTNYRTKFGEADIIATYNNEIVFIEVKTRSNSKFGTPAEAVNYQKQKRYRDIAKAYMLQNCEYDMPFSFAIVEILGEEINLIENAF
jgi:putative endonuclease